MDISNHENDRLLTIKDIAKRLNVSLNKAHMMTNPPINDSDLNKIPCLRMGKIKRVWQSDLETYITKHMSNVFFGKN